MQTKTFIRPKLRVLRKALTAASLLCLLETASAFASIWYVAPSGSDTNGGTLVAPFASITKAQSVASSGDTVYLRGGTYTTFSIAASDANYNYVHNITKSGIGYLAYPGDPRPIFDVSSISPSGLRVCAFQVTGSNNTFQGFDVTGVQAGSHPQCDNWRISGNGNTLRWIVNRDDQGYGVYLRSAASSNLVENCDSYNLIGVSGTSAGNTDGFGCHASGSGNVFRGCRAWACSDDGYDCINNSGGGILFDHCWAYDNGRLDGNKTGFKIGGYGCSTGAFPNPPPVHTVQFCLSAKNGANGFYANHQPGRAANWYNNTAYNNASANFNMLEAIDTTVANCSVPGTREVMHNNLAYVGTLIANLNESGSNVSYNSWTLPVTVNGADFASVDPTQMTQSRKADGSLPDIAFMHLVSGSDLVDAGTNVGFGFNGSAPDLGAFESLTPFQAWQTSYFGSTNSPSADPNADPDGDGLSNQAEFLAGTNPTNAASALRILSAVEQGSDVNITWATAGVRTNIVQATTGDANGGYTNNFTDISGPIIIPASGDAATNFTDVGAATNSPGRYYRIRLLVL